MKELTPMHDINTLKSMKIHFTILILFMLNINYVCYAADTSNLPNPWRQSISSNETEESEIIFFNAIKEYELSKTKYIDYAKERKSKELLKIRIEESSSKGNIKARLVEMARFTSPNDSLVIDTFKFIDQSNDSRLLYEVGKLIEFKYLLCMNVIDKDGIPKVERRCQVPENERPGFISSYNEKAGRLLEEKRLQRAFGYILKAANLKYPPAQYEIGYRMLKDKKNIPTDGATLEEMRGTKAEEWLKNSAEAGYADAVLLVEETRKAMQLEATQIAKNRSVVKDNEVAKPECVSIVFSGVAAANSPYSIEQVLNSKNTEDLIARNPIACEYREWGGYYAQNGGVINRNRSTECRGVDYFNNKRAKILNSFENFYYIETDIDFNTGRRSTQLYIRRTDARCVK